MKQMIFGSEKEVYVIDNVYYAFYLFDGLFTNQMIQVYRSFDQKSWKHYFYKPIKNNEINWDYPTNYSINYNRKLSCLCEKLVKLQVFL